MNNHATFHEVLYVIPVIFHIKDETKTEGADTLCQYAVKLLLSEQILAFHSSV